MKEKNMETCETVENLEQDVAMEEGTEVDVEVEEAEEVDELAQLTQAKKEAEQRLLRAHADLENFKKRVVREKQEAITYANKNIFIQLLNVLDNFERAMMVDVDPKDNFVIGVKMIQKQLTDVLTQNGVELIDAEGKNFDPYLHEAFATEETTEHPENSILEVYQKGFRFAGSLLRPAKVKVAAAPNDGNTEASDN